MALKPSQGISRYLTRPHKATNRARLMLICINQCMYNFQQNFILPSSCSTQLLLNQSMQFFISHTKLWHLGSCLPKLSIVKCHCISGNLARDQKIMVLPQQFNISSSPHCSFSLNFIQPTTHESSFFVVNVISQILSHFIISSLPCIHLGTQGPL